MPNFAPPPASLKDRLPEPVDPCADMRIGAGRIGNCVEGGSEEPSGPLWPTTYGANLDYRWAMNGKFPGTDGLVLTRTLLFDPSAYGGARNLTNIPLGSNEYNGNGMVDYGTFFAHLGYGVALNYDGTVKWIFEPDNTTVRLYHGIATPEVIYWAVDNNAPSGIYAVIAVDPNTGERIATLPNPSLNYHYRWLHAKGDGALIWAGFSGNGGNVTFDGSAFTLEDTGVKIVSETMEGRYTISADKQYFYSHRCAGSICSIHKYDNDFALQWQSAYDFNACRKVMELDDGTILTADNPGGSNGPVIVHIDPNDGSTIETYQYPPGTNNNLWFGSQFLDGTVALIDPFGPGVYLFDPASWQPIQTVTLPTPSAAHIIPKMDSGRETLWATSLALYGIKSDGSFIQVSADTGGSLNVELPYAGGVIGYYAGISKFEIP